MKKPEITLAITTFNRGAQLYNSLRRLADLTLPSVLMIIDDGSDPKLEPVVKSLAPLFKNISLEYHYLNNPGYDVCSIPRNVAVKQCQTEFFMTSEPEIVFVTDVVAQMAAQISAVPDKVISTGVVYAMHRRAKSSDQVFLNPRQYLVGEPYELRVGWVAPYSALYKTQWLLDINGWDENFSIKNGGGGYAWDDTDLLTRLRVRGINQHIDQNIEVIHQWHEPAPSEVADRQFLNENMFLAKDLDNHPENAIANIGKEWGVWL